MKYRGSFRAFTGMLMLTLSSLQGAQPARAQAESGEKVYQRTLKSAVWLLSPRGGGRASTGTGSLIDRTRKLVVTNYHVVGDSDQVVALFPTFQQGKLVAERSFYLDQARNGSGIAGKVLVKDDRRDLALIQLDMVPNGVLEVALARDSAGPGQRVHSVGNPGGSGALWVYTSGTVRTQPYHKKWQATDGKTVFDFEAQVLETQSPTNPGDSGGPLLNDRTEFVAITQGSSNDGQLLSLFVDVSEVKALMKTKGLANDAAAPRASQTAANKLPVPAEGEKAEQLATTKLNFAKTLATDGKLDRAKERYQEIIRLYPTTEAAKEAKQILQKLNR